MTYTLNISINMHMGKAKLVKQCQRLTKNRGSNPCAHTITFFVGGGVPSNNPFQRRVARVSP
jgi:hypothetical protein